MPLHLYEVTISTGRSNRNHAKFHSNVSELRAKASDYGGINAVCVVSHSQDARTVHLLCTDGFKSNKADVEVAEITDATLADVDSTHRLHVDLIRDYYLPHGKYINITSVPD